MSGEKWVFTNWNAFITRSFSIQEMHNGFCICAYDDGSKNWIQVSDVVNNIEVLEIEMKKLHKALIDENFNSVSYFHKKEGDAE